MIMEDIIKKVNIKKLYEHILRLEGNRHPASDLNNLNKAADYIASKLETYGLITTQQEFKIKGFDEPFRNIEGSIGDGSQPELVIISHYDTVENCPGANDNASGVALMLECARVLAEEQSDCNVRFISFSLEEGNPYIDLQCKKKARELGMTDERNRYTSVTIHQFMRNYDDLFYSFRGRGKSYIDAHRDAMEEIDIEAPELVQNYFKHWKGYYADLDRQGKNMYCVGSEKWLEEALKRDLKMKGVLCFDTIAYTEKRLHSQRFPESMTPRILRSIFDTYKVDFDEMIGNFLTVIASKGSEQIMEAFIQSASNQMIDLPYACAHFKIGYEQLASTFPDLLRSDHGAFWRENIPGLFLSDSANFRFPYYHSPADTIDRLDFNFLEKVTKTALRTILQLNK
ncbi:MAG: M28 family peptidase [Promethearchaeota archaeon]|nr:MAG: M28 family peptidase [Candidatus Lokiarchaeota archaeon]